MTMPRLLAFLLAIFLLANAQPQSVLAADELVPAHSTEDTASGSETLATPAATGEDAQHDAGSAVEIEEIKIDQRPPMVDRAHQRISSGVLATAHWLDEFFSDPRVESEESKTRVKVRFSLLAEDGEGFEYDVRAGVRLDLPILKNRLQLLIAGDPEDDNDFQALTGREGVPPELADDEENLSIALRYFWKRTVKRNVSVRSGVRFRSGMPHLYLEPRYRQTVPLDDWIFRFTQRVIGITDGTVRARTTVDFERALREKLFFRFTLDGTWDKDEHGYFYTVGPSLYQPLSPRRVLVYSWSNSYVTHPNHRLESYGLSVRYRQRIWRDWLYYEVIPQINFPRDENFDVTPGIGLRLEMVFGHYRQLPPMAEQQRPAQP